MHTVLTILGERSCLCLSWCLFWSKERVWNYICSTSLNSCDVLTNHNECASKEKHGFSMAFPPALMYRLSLSCLSHMYWSHFFVLFDNIVTCLTLLKKGKSFKKTDVSCFQGTVKHLIVNLYGFFDLDCDLFTEVFKVLPYLIWSVFSPNDPRRYHIIMKHEGQDWITLRK